MMFRASVLPFFNRTARPMPRDKADALLLLLSCALVIAPHASHLPLWVTLVCATLLIWRGWITFHGNRMPPRWLLLPVATGVMAAVWAHYQTFFGRDAGVAMLALLLTLKLLEMHAKRDLFIALFLSDFLILSNFFYSQSIATAVLTIIAMLAILTTQLSFQYTSAVPPLRQRLRQGAMVLALATPLTLALFLLFPRIQGPLWGLPADATAKRTGLSDTMSPGNISQLALSDEVAFRVKFADRVPPKQQLYWRGVVLGAYDGRTWTPVKAWQGEREIRVHLRGTPTHYQVTLEPHGKRWVFALDVPQALPELPGNPTTVTPDMQLLSLQPINERIRYNAVSHIDYELQPGDAAPTGVRQWLQLPQGFNPRTLEMAEQLRTRHAGDQERINAVLHHFREQEFRYTLQPPLLGRDNVDDFLFLTRAGFCEHYASAFVVLMRAMGLPARVVMGYQGGEINPVDSYMEVRQSDAHAWAEVWLKGRGWVRFDPTAAVAPQRVERNLGSAIPRPAFGGLIMLDANGGILQRLRQNWDAVTNAWNQWVLNYTPEKQKDFFKLLGFKNVDWRTMALVMTVVGILVGAAILLPLMLYQRKRDPVEAIYRLLCARLAQRGFPRAAHEGPRNYCQRLTAADSPLPAAQKAALARFLVFYETVRYGRPDTLPSSYLKQLKQLSAECRSFL